MTKRLVCESCGSDNHFGNLNCKDCGNQLWIRVKLPSYSLRSELLYWMVAGLVLGSWLVSLYFLYNFTPVKDKAAAVIGKKTIAASTKHIVSE